MNWIADRLFNASGRIGRLTFLGYFAASLPFTMVASFQGAAPIVRLLCAIASLLCTMAPGVRRLHDMNVAGTFILVAFIPLINLVLLCSLLLIPGTRGPNRFGERKGQS